MSKFLNTIAACVIATATALPLAAAPFGLGRAALPEEIAAWDVDVLPDGRGLPEGQGDGPHMILFTIRSRYVQGTKNHV